MKQNGNNTRSARKGSGKKESIERKWYAENRRNGDFNV